MIFMRKFLHLSLSVQLFLPFLDCLHFLLSRLSLLFVPPCCFLPLLPHFLLYLSKHKDSLPLQLLLEVHY